MEKSAAEFASFRRRDEGLEFACESQSRAVPAGENGETRISQRVPAVLCPGKATYLLGHDGLRLCPETAIFWGTMFLAQTISGRFDG